MRLRVRAPSSLALLLLLLAPGAPAEEPPVRPRDLARAVDAAIARGTEWLRGRQLPDGAFAVRPIPMFYVSGEESLGPTALALYTLRACGAPADDPAVRRGFRRLREMHDSKRRVRQGLDTYGVSLTILALEAHHAAPPAEAPRGGAVPAAPPSRRIPAEDLDWLRDLTAWLGGAQAEGGAFTYWSPAPASAWDYSNTQFALLALKASRRCGIEVPRAVWLAAMGHLLDHQERKGPSIPRFDPGPASGGRTPSAAKDQARGWGYAARSPATGSMTAGGVSSLVICRSELLGTPGYSEALDAKAERAVHDGLAWLGAAFSVRENPGPAGAPAMKDLWQYYWLYGVERAGVLAGVAWMGRHDWYAEGAAYLLEVQRDNGSWIHEGALAAGAAEPGVGPDAPTANLLDTCFALLFLRRATFKVERGAVATEGWEGSLDLSGADGLDARAFGALFDAVFARFRDARGPDRDARAADFVLLGTRSLPLLVRRLESEEEASRAAALDALRRTTGETRGFAADAPPGARASAVAAWEEWWMAAKDRLVADPAAGRFAQAPPGDPGNR